jgi:hypothetical protein
MRFVTKIPATSPEERIRYKAYELYIKRGMQDGNELEDWLEAEREVLEMEEKEEKKAAA